MNWVNRSCERLKYTNLTRVVEMIGNGPFDAVVMMTPENVPYFSGFYNMDLRLLPERIHIVVWPRDGEPTFIVMSRRQRLMRQTDTFITDVRGYDGEGLDSVKVLADVLRERGLNKGSIGIEAREFPGGHLMELRRLMPQLEFGNAVGFLDSIRSVKTAAEIDTLRRVNHLTAEAIETAFRSARPGDTERELSSRMQSLFLNGGGEQITAPLLASGERTGLWHAMASDRRIEPGDIITTDFGGLIDGYFSDLARTAVMGKASPHQRDVHSRVTEIKHRLVAAMRPGVTAAEVARVGRAAYDEFGLEFKWFILGHGVGLALHEEPQLYPWTDTPLLPGMTLMVETGYSDYPNESFHVEDLVLVGEHGAEYVTDASRHEDIWELGLD